MSNPSLLKIIDSNEPATSAGSVPQRKAELEPALDLIARKTCGNIKALTDETKWTAWAVDKNHFAFKKNIFDIGDWPPFFFTGNVLWVWGETRIARNEITT